MITDLLALRFFKSLIESPAGLTTATAKGISNGNFKDPVIQAIYSWILDYHAKHGGMPSASAVDSQFSLTLPTVCEPIDFICDEIVNRSTAYALSDVLKAVGTALESKDTAKAVSILSTAVASLATISKVEVTEFATQAEARIADYKAAAAAGTLAGLPTPWPTLTSVTGGWVAGTLNVALGLANVGKTYFTCICAKSICDLGKKALLVSMEMPAGAVLRRLDCMQFKLPLPAMRNGTLDATNLALWETGVKSWVPGGGEITVVDKQTVSTVADIFRLVQTNKYDAVVIDGAYRLEPTKRSRAVWEGHAEVVNDLQKYAEVSGIPWICTSQLNEIEEDTKKSRRTGSGSPINMYGAKYAKEYVINPDVVVGMWATPADRSLQQLHLYILKVRDIDPESLPDGGKISCNWSLSRWDFSELVLTGAALGVTGVSSAASLGAVTGLGKAVSLVTPAKPSVAGKSGVPTPSSSTISTPVGLFDGS
jgi:replicative DNA helicase